jgi:hypothetical protein
MGTSQVDQERSTEHAQLTRNAHEWPMGQSS